MVRRRHISASGGRNELGKNLGSRTTFVFYSILKSQILIDLKTTIRSCESMGQKLDNQIKNCASFLCWSEELEINQEDNTVYSDMVTYERPIETSEGQ